MSDYAKPDTSMSSTVFEGMKVMMEKSRDMASPMGETVKKIESVSSKAINATTAGTLARGEAVLKTAKAQMEGGLGVGKGGGMHAFGGGSGAGFEGTMAKINRRQKPQY